MPLCTLLAYDSTEVSQDEIRKIEPCAEAWTVIPEAGQGFEGTEKEVLETMRMYDLCGFNEDQN